MVDSDAPASVPEGGRRLVLRFADAAAFRVEYERNLIQGGVFVPTRESFELRESVQVVLELPFRDAKLVLPAEVVHCSGPGEAASGAVPGVAVQFSEAVRVLRERLEPLLEEGREPPSAKGSADSLELAFEPTSLGDAPRASKPPPPERRQAPRSAARVSVGVEGPNGGRLAARTRDLSRDGVLLTVEGSELPVGRGVRLALVHPEDGRVLELSGSVVRRVEAEGTVPAVAIRFEPEPGSEAQALQFVEEVQAAEHRHGNGAVRGPIEALGPEVLLRMLSLHAPKGTLTLVHGVEEAVVTVADGTILSARLGGLAGTKALARLLGWRSGHFEFRPRLEPRAPGEPAGPPLGAAGTVLAEAERLHRDSLEAGGPELAPSARLTVVAGGLERFEGRLDKTEEAVLDLAGARFTVRRILDVIPESDAVIRAAIASLLEQELVRVLPEE